MIKVHFLPGNQCIEVEEGTALLDAAAQAGAMVDAPCGGEGICGECRVRIEAGTVDGVRRGCLSSEDTAAGVVLACSSRLIADVTVRIPERHQSATSQIVTESAASPLPRQMQVGGPTASVVETLEPLAVKRFLQVDPPTSSAAASDVERLTRALVAADPSSSRTQVPAPTLSVLRQLATALRSADHRVTVTVAQDAQDGGNEIIAIEPGDTTARQFGLAIDVGTTTCAIRLIDLNDGRIVGTAADYNGQLTRGADVISRINYARTPQRAEELRQLVLSTINGLIIRLRGDHGLGQAELVCAAIAGNTTMMHLLLGLPPEYIRLAPYIPTVNRPPVLTARDIDLAIMPGARVWFAPGVGSYVGGDITAGVLQTALAAEGSDVRLFLDFGTNGEVVVGNGEWLMACAASAGPAFEGSGVSCGMRAMSGAIETVRIDPATGGPVVSVIGGGRPLGICGSGMVDLLAELFSAGIIDPAGKLDPARDAKRIRPVDGSTRNLAYTIVDADHSQTGKPITIDDHDIANLLRTKAAVYSACAILLTSVGLSFDDLVEVYVAGGFGRFLNLRQSIAIGLLPDLPVERFTYLGNSALTGAHAALCSATARRKVMELADRMTYLELNTEPAYMSEYTAALFLPHTDIDRFPSVKRIQESRR